MTDPITRGLHDLREECIARAEPGRVADYIPELQYADPEAFGIVLESHEGDVYAAGESDMPFTIQSISKPFVYALAVEALGIEDVSARVGAEPSGEPFNAISLEPGTGRPANPLVNAGAILTTSLVPGGFERIAEGLSAFAGRPLDVDEAVYRSEHETGHRNIAIAHLMRATGALERDVHATADDYFRQCSLIVTTRDLAYMAATLANAGRDPVTGTHVVSETTVQHTLSLMAMCGMYDGAGEWMLRVGLPAKSGVSGGVLAVSPGQFGVGLFSPPLNERGNSVRAVLACERMAQRFGLHVFHDATAGARAAKVTERDGVLVLHGDIDFAAAERVLRLSQDGTRRLDLSGVTRLHPAAERLLDAIVDFDGPRLS
jgi:glutaminase